MGRRSMNNMNNNISIVTITSWEDCAAWVEVELSAFQFLLFWLLNNKFRPPLLSIKPTVDWKSWHADNNIKSDIFIFSCFLSLYMSICLSLSFTSSSLSTFSLCSLVFCTSPGERDRGNVSAIGRQTTSVEKSSWENVSVWFSDIPLFKRGRSKRMSVWMCR